MPSSDSHEDTLIAAVDLGSNSFHMIVARLRGDHFDIVDRIRESVRLGAGLDEQEMLTPEIQRFALDCLSRFGQRLAGMAPANVRAVGTNTLRKARNGKRFLDRAQDALGHSIDIISGVEEARLIHLGVASAMPNAAQRHLVIDIGGGSTEFIIGEGDQPLLMESLAMGSVACTRDYFRGGAIRAKQFQQAVLAAELELEPIKQSLRDLGWLAAMGASGTIRAIEKVVTTAGWSAGGVTKAALAKLRDEMLRFDNVDKLKLPGLADDRAPILPGGVAVLTAIFESLKLETLNVSERALREGLLYDLMGRRLHTDVRERTVAALIARYKADSKQAKRVQQTALSLLGQVADAWKLQGENQQQTLAWAAALHEIGLAVAHSQYQRHGAYLIEHGDLPGFMGQEQKLIAAVVAAHRRKWNPELFADLPEDRVECSRKLAVLLRLSVLLHRSRSAGSDPGVTLTVEKKTLRLRFAGEWLAAHPLTRADLEREQSHLKAAKWELEFE